MCKLKFLFISVTLNGLKIKNLHLVTLCTLVLYVGCGSGVPSPLIWTESLTTELATSCCQSFETDLKSNLKERISGNTVS